MIDFSIDGEVAIVRLDDPATLNAIWVESSRALRDAVYRAGRDARAMVLAGSARCFSAGGNLASVDPETLATLDGGIALRDDLGPMMLALRDLPIPWISAVRGAAAGGGAGLALAADMIVAGDTAYFLQAFVHVGLVPDCGAAYLLARTAGRPRAMELILLGERLTAMQALDWGLVNRVVPDAEVEPVAIALARRLARGPATAMALTRRLVWESMERSLADCLQRESEHQRIASADPDFAEGLASFLEKRRPSFGAGRSAG